MAGDPILYRDECVGYVSSGGTGFRLGQCLALGFIKARVDTAAAGFEVEILGKSCTASFSKLFVASYLRPDWQLARISHRIP